MNEEAIALLPPSSPNLAADAVTAKESYDTDPSSMSFVDLPAEVRNAIYGQLFPEGLSAVQLLARSNGGFISMSDRLGLLMTCHQVYIEASSFLRCQSRVTIVPSKSIFDIMDCNWEVEFTILDLVLPDKGLEITLDLDSGSIGGLPALMQTNSLFRSRIMRSIYGEVTVEVETSTLNNFRELHEWVNEKRPRRQSDWLENVFNSTYTYTIKMQPDSCFSATEFVWATSGLTGHRLFCTRIVNHADWHLKPKALIVIYAKLYLIIDDLLQRFPDRRSGPCPTIWMSRYLEPIRAEFTLGDGTIESVAGKLWEWDKHWEDEDILAHVWDFGMRERWQRSESTTDYDQVGSLERESEKDEEEEEAEEEEAEEEEAEEEEAEEEEAKEEEAEDKGGDDDGEVMDPMSLRDFAAWIADLLYHLYWH